MDRETFEELLWLGCGIELERLMWINQPGKDYVMSLGIQFAYKDNSTRMVLDFSDVRIPFDKVLEILANTLYFKVRDMEDDD